MVKKIYKKFGQKINTKNFFTSKNKLLQSKFNKTYINKLKRHLYQKASLKLIKKNFNKYSSSLSSYSKSSNIKQSLVLKSPKWSFNSNEIMITKEEDSKNPNQFHLLVVWSSK